jgi:putative membrane protein
MTMKKNMNVALLAAVLGLGCSAVSFADTTPADVLNDLHAANGMEVHMGKLAEEKGSTAEARDYGKTLVKDHQDNDKQVTDLASKQGITLKTETPGLMDKMEMKKLKSQSGAEFDRAFAKNMIDDHKKDIAKMQSALKSQLPEDVRKLVADTLPTLQKHLELAQKIYGQPS